MADPAGITGTAAGIVSLGLQLYSGISSYIDAVKGRGAELDAVSRQLQGLRRSLNKIEVAIPNLPSQCQNSGNDIISCLTDCQKDLQALEALFGKLVDSPTTPTDFKAKIKEQKKKLSFPFHRQDLRHLDDRLQKVNSVLQTAMQELQLEATSLVDKHITNVKSTVDKTSTDVFVLGSELATLNTTTSSVNGRVSAVLSTVDSFLPEMRGEANKLSQKTSHNQESLSLLEYDIKAIQTTLNYIATQTQLQNRSLSDTLRGLIDDTNANTRLIRDEISGADTRLMSDLFERSDRPDMMMSTLMPTKGSQFGGMNQDAENSAVGRLLSKPNALKGFCDELLPQARQNSNRSTHLAIASKERHVGWPVAPRCTCFYRGARSSTSNAIGYGPVLIRFSSTREHKPDCKYRGEAKSSTNIEISYNGLRSILWKSISLSMSLAFGAGGMSITPSLAFRPVVDSEISPPFRIMELLYLLTSPGQLSSDLTIQFVYLSLRRLIRTYQDGKASPYDVDDQGRSLFHEWVSTMVYLIRDVIQEAGPAIQFTNFLLDCGIPANLSDSTGFTPAMELFGIPFELLLGYNPDEELLELFLREAPEITFAENHRQNYMDFQDEGGPEGLLEIFRKSNRCAEFLHCGPLHIAVLAGDIDHIKNILSKDSSTLAETTIYGQTPLHLSADNPEVLRLLLDWADIALMNQADEAGLRAIDYALRLSTRMCPDNCPCQESVGIECVSVMCVDMFLKRECHLETSRTVYPLRLMSLWYHLSSASQACRVRVLEELHNRRSSLKSLGLQHLTPNEIHRYQLDQSHQLDCYANQVIAILRSRHIDVPGHLQPAMVLEDIHNKITFTSLYHSLAAQLDAEIWADMLHRLEFFDIDVPDSRGLTPLMVVAMASHGWTSYGYTLWLIDHGADIWRAPPADAYYWCPIKDGLTAGHRLLLDAFNCYHDQRSKDRIRKTRRLVNTIAPYHRPDGCCCACTIEGCEPLTGAFKNLWHDCREEMWTWSSSSVKGITARITKSLENYSEDLSQWDHVCVSALRLLTFEALELTHTCCDLPYLREYSADEIHYIHDEDEEQISVLEELVEDFNVQYKEAKVGLNEFLTMYWAPRMEQVLRDQENARPSLEAQKLKATEMGVDWDTASEDSTEEEDKTSLDYWVKRLDEIYPPPA